MRYFSTREKKYLKILSEIDSISGEVMQNLIEKEFFPYDDDFVISYEEEDVLKLFVRKSKKIDNDTRNNKCGEFIEFMHLLKYLNNKEYVSFFNIENDFYRTRYKKSEPKPDNIKTLELHANFSDFNLHKSICILFKETCTGSIWIHEDLRMFVKNNFKTKEDLKFIKEQKLSKSGLKAAYIIGLSGLIASIVIPLFVAKLESKKNIPVKNIIYNETKTDSIEVFKTNKIKLDSGITDSIEKSIQK